ncbi:hypothetical protein JMA_20890 [Jeotgalibacillus malaysiensis]|uniref:PDZ domain-containing protein n=1 Tax=Jeotgalibacillus malaysiensis TaxID=1508404 RepID=A0A0B5AMS0_9BACL|nr:PDZ domain-containing protein [Jeotgalibacillus malaysiensis]AJD91406.1 hypothetical protein JMA_20890 [Jeotgalibacillus malaysiensis]
MFNKLILVILILSSVTAHFCSAAELIPGGQSIGIVLESNGVLVTGFYAPANEKSPSERTGIKIGDRISSVNHTRVNTVEELNSAIKKAETKKQVRLEVIRDKNTLIKNVTVMKNEKGEKQLGFLQSMKFWVLERSRIFILKHSVSVR